MICHTLSSFSSLARSAPPLSFSPFPFSPFRMESSPSPLIERAKSCGFSTKRWTLVQMAAWRWRFIVRSGNLEKNFTIWWNEECHITRTNCRTQQKCHPSRIKINKYHRRVTKWQLCPRPSWRRECASSRWFN